MKKIIFVLLSSFYLVAADLPTALVQTADPLALDSYELVLTPQVLFSSVGTGGTYLNSELRYQPAEDFGMGLGFGSGEVGFNVGVYTKWHVFPDLSNQPAFAVTSGVYLNRFASQNYFVIKLAPTVSKMVKGSWGVIAPYGALQLSPSFALGSAQNDIALATRSGILVEPKMFGGLRTWFEIGFNLSNSQDEIAVGLSYPFGALEG